MGLRQRSFARSLCAAIVATCLALAASSGVASAEVTTHLGPIGFASVVVDTARGHVFVSGPAANVVDVLDFSGHPVARIPNVSGAWGMVLTGGSLYVVESTADEVVRVNPNTLAVGKPIATGISRPSWIASSGGYLWVAEHGEWCCWASLTSINLKSGAVRRFEWPIYYAPDFATSPADPGTLFLAQDVISGGSVYRFRVASGEPIQKAYARTNGENIQNIAVSPDGTRVLVAAGWPYDFEELSAHTLEPDGVVYPGQAYPSAVAVSGAAADRFAMGTAGYYNSPDIWVDPVGTPSALFTATTTDARGYHDVLQHGLALSADGRTLFAAYEEGESRKETVLATIALP